MYCPNCRKSVPDEALFCPECGARLDDNMNAPHVPGESVEHRPMPDAGSKHRIHPLIWVVTALVGLVVIGGIAAGIMLANASAAAANTPHPVTFMVSIQGMDNHSSRIPVHITGTDHNGNDVDKTIFLAYEGVDTELPNGSYHAEVIGSPITSTGVIFALPKNGVDFTLSIDLDVGEPYVLPNNRYFEFTPLADEDLTQEAVDDALSWARKDEESGADVGKLEKALNERLAKAQGTKKDDTPTQDDGEASKPSGSTTDSSGPDGTHNDA